MYEISWKPWSSSGSAMEYRSRHTWSDQCISWSSKICAFFWLPSQLCDKRRITFRQAINWVFRPTFLASYQPLEINCRQLKDKLHASDTGRAISRISMSCASARITTHTYRNAFSCKYDQQRANVTGYPDQRLVAATFAYAIKKVPLTSPGLSAYQLWLAARFLHILFFFLFLNDEK